MLDRRLADEVDVMLHDLDIGPGTWEPDAE